MTADEAFGQTQPYYAKPDAHLKRSAGEETDPKREPSKRAQLQTDDYVLPPVPETPCLTPANIDPGVQLETETVLDDSEGGVSIVDVIDPALIVPRQFPDRALIRTPPLSQDRTRTRPWTPRISRPQQVLNLARLKLFVIVPVGKQEYTPYTDKEGNLIYVYTKPGV